MRRRQILLVEDDRSVREVLSLFFEETYDVEHAPTGSEALAILHREPITIVVLDYRLPDRTGLEVLTEIRAIRPRLPVIMVTGYGSESLCASAFRLGISDYIPKPFNAFALVDSVRRILSTASEQSVLARSVLENGRGEDPLSGCFVRKDSLPIEKAAKVIQQRYWDHLSLSQLAREVGMSKYRLSRRFKDVMGIGFRAYLIRVRLERATRLLATQASITEVAQMVGFADLPRFDKLFKRYTGVTPSTYRAQQLAPATKGKDPARNY